jgi:hypothetical protein
LSNIYSAYQHQSSGFQPERLPSYSLRVLLRSNVLVYAVIDAKGNIMAVKEYRSKSPMDFPAFFDAIYEQDYFLKEEFDSVEIIQSNLEFSLIPTVYFKPNQVHEFAGALIKSDCSLDHVDYTDLGMSGATAIYTVPFPVKQKCDHYFPEGKYQPVCKLMINMGMELSKVYPDLVLLHFFEKQFVITACKEGRLQICNAYDFEEVTDVVYFLQLVMEILKMEIDTTSVLLSGEFEEDSELSKQLKKYVPSASIPKFSFQDRFDTKSDKLPSWKYAFLTW